MGYKRRATGLRKRYGRSVAKKRELTVFEKHSLRIARATLNMPDAMVGVLGGPTKEQARQIILELTGRDPGK